MEKKRPSGCSKSSLADVLGIVLKPSLALSRRAKHDFFKPKLKPPAERLKRIIRVGASHQAALQFRTDSSLAEGFKGVLTVKSKPLKSHFEKFAVGKHSLNLSAFTTVFAKSENLTSKTINRRLSKSSIEPSRILSHLRLEGW